MATVNKRENMNIALKLLKEFVIHVALVIGILCILAICFRMYPAMHEVGKIDCSLAEFSPDFSLEIKQACREARRSRT
jgi:hypothetical protein